MSNDERARMFTLEAVPTLTRLPIKRFSADSIAVGEDTLIAKDKDGNNVGTVRLAVTRSVRLTDPTSERTVSARAIMQDGVTALLRAERIAL